MKSMVTKFQTRLFKVLAFLLVMAITFPLLNEVNVNAAKKPGQVKISEVKETDSKIVVKFKKIHFQMLTALISKRIISQRCLIRPSKLIPVLIM